MQRRLLVAAVLLMLGTLLATSGTSTTAYWDARIPTNSVKTAGSGLKIDILGVSQDKTTYRVHL